jgi:hypothetical protein
MITKIYVVVDGNVEQSYWTTEKLALVALERYRKAGLVSAKAEVEVLGVNIDGFTRRKLEKK